VAWVRSWRGQLGRELLEVFGLLAPEVQLERLARRRVNPQVPVSPSCSATRLRVFSVQHRMSPAKNPATDMMGE
jgi:hypothetical protein